jgi:hypothetical protein
MDYTSRFNSIINQFKNSGKNNKGPAKLIREALKEEHEFWESRWENSGDTKQREVLRNRLLFLEEAMAKPDQYVPKENTAYNPKK